MAVRVWFKDGEVNDFDKAKDFVAEQGRGIILIDTPGMGRRVAWLNPDVVEMVFVMSDEDDDTDLPVVLDTSE